MAYLGKKPEDIFKGNATYSSFTGDGSTTAFDVSNLLPDGGEFDVEVFVDNVRQEAGSSKSYTIGQDGSGDLKRINFNVAPDSGSEIYVINPGRETAIVTLSDNTVSAAKIQSDAVTTAKILDSNVTTAKIAADAITGAKIADDAINSEHLVDGSVDNVHLAGSIANAKLANSSITINGTAVSLGGSVTAGTDWQAVVVADGSTQLTAVAGRGYFLDTNAGVIEVLLPSSPSRGDTFIFADYGNNFATNRVVIDTAGKLIDSTVGGEPDRDFVLETNGQVVELVFVDDTSGYLVKQNNTPSDLDADTYAEYIEATGGTITTSGNFKVHTFTGDGNFVVSKVGNPAGSTSVDYLVVAGGGGGGNANANSNGSSGGGGGGFRMSNTTCMPGPQTSPLASSTAITVTATTFPITVGGGGAGNPNCAPGCSGSNSVFSTITSAGGGQGSGNQDSPTAPGIGGNGGSGGGGHQGPGSPPGCRAGIGNTPPVSPPQGNPGGGASAPSGNGGGGAGASGGNTQPGPNNAGTGAIGSFVVACGFAGCNGEGCGPVSGTRYFAGGGGGANSQGRSPAGNPGGTSVGGGGNQNTAGDANTGGGGGGGAIGGNSGAGGKGIVIIRYKFQS